MRSLAIEVYGDPVPQGSKRAFVVKGKPILTESAGERLKTWRQDIVAAARRELNGDAPMEGALRVTIFCYLRQPKKPKNALPITRPDSDKLARSILDGLTTAGVMRDDAQVTSMTVRKRYTTETPRATIHVAEESP